MPTRTPQTRRSSTSPSRFSRPGQPQRTGAGRFSKPSAQKPGGRGRKQQTGVSGLLSSAMTALPKPGSQKHRKGSAGGGKGKPAMALLAAAGAVLGRRQMQKRKGAEVPPTSTTPTA